MITFLEDNEHHHHYTFCATVQLLFELQPPEVQQLLLAKREARKQALKNAAERKQLIHYASFHFWCDSFVFLLFFPPHPFLFMFA